LFSVTAFADLRRKGNPIVIFASDGDKLRRLAGCRHSGKPILISGLAARAYRAEWRRRS
jgi:hypothetical protein